MPSECSFKSSEKAHQKNRLQEKKGLGKIEQPHTYFALQLYIFFLPKKKISFLKVTFPLKMSECMSFKLVLNM